MNDIVLLTGGIDSTLCLWKAQLRGPVLALNVDYGQLAAETERATSAHFAAQCGIGFRHLQIAGVRDVLRSALTGHGDVSTPQQTVVPGRNAMLLSIAAGLAVSVGAKRVWIGCNADDAEVYADCRLSFLDAMHSLLMQTYGVGIERPLVEMTKADVVSAARALRIPLEHTSSCYTGNACGVCSACKLRAKVGL